MVRVALVTRAILAGLGAPVVIRPRAFCRRRLTMDERLAPASPLVVRVQGKDFIGVADFDRPRLATVWERAVRLKHDRQIGRPHALLPGRIVALIFQKPSLRTRVSFEVGMTELGGQALYLSPAEVGLGERESPADVARVLSRMVHAIVARTYKHHDV